MKTSAFFPPGGWIHKRAEGEGSWNICVGDQVSIAIMDEEREGKINEWIWMNVTSSSKIAASSTKLKIDNDNDLQGSTSC